MTWDFYGLWFSLIIIFESYDYTSMSVWGFLMGYEAHPFDSLSFQSCMTHSVDQVEREVWVPNLLVY